MKELGGYAVIQSRPFKHECQSNEANPMLIEGRHERSLRTHLSEPIQLVGWQKGWRKTRSSTAKASPNIDCACECIHRHWALSGFQIRADAALTVSAY